MRCGVDLLCMPGWRARWYAALMVEHPRGAPMPPTFAPPADSPTTPSALLGRSRAGRDRREQR